MSTGERFAVVAAGFERRIVECPADRWDEPTPCLPWNARELVEHVLDVFGSVLAAVGATIPDSASSGQLARWHASKAAMLAAVDDPILAAHVIPSPIGDFALKQVVGGVILHDLLIHTWDLARATGQDEQLDPGNVAAALAKMTPFDEFLRGPAMFGPKVTPPPHADEQTQLLCFLGREP